MVYTLGRLRMVMAKSRWGAEEIPYELGWSATTWTWGMEILIPVDLWWTGQRTFRLALGPQPVGWRP